MRHLRRPLAIGAIAFMSVLAFGAPSAEAQSTYLDVPFNQGSLFYRPSVLRAPRPRVARNPVFAPRATRYVAAAPAASVLVAPRRTRVYYPRPRIFTPRTRWFGY